jgi:hypothetical protein
MIRRAKFKAFFQYDRREHPQKCFLLRIINKQAVNKVKMDGIEDAIAPAFQCTSPTMMVSVLFVVYFDNLKG